MFQFEISSDGQIHEADVFKAVSQLKQIFPGTDAAALEATLMLERTHALMLDDRVAYYSRFGITARRFTLLRHLYLAEGRRLSMGDIATVMNAGTPSVTQIIAALVRDDLVSRVTDLEDKRVAYAVLTEKGIDVFENVFAQNSVRLRETWTALTDREKVELINMLARLRIHLLAKRPQLSSTDPGDDDNASDYARGEP